MEWVFEPGGPGGVQFVTARQAEKIAPTPRKSPRMLNSRATPRRDAQVVDAAHPSFAGAQRCKGRRMELASQGCIFMAA